VFTKPRTNSRFFTLLCVACSALSACGGDDDGNDEPVGPSGPVELRIEGFMNNQGESFDRDADEVVLSCDGSINVLFGPRSGADLENWVLRPPGACESFVQCGYIVLSATPEGGEVGAVAPAASPVAEEGAPPEGAASEATGPEGTAPEASAPPA